MAGAADACARRLAAALQTGATSNRHSQEVDNEGDRDTERAPVAASEDTDTPAEEPVEQQCAGCSHVKPRAMFSDAQWCNRARANISFFICVAEQLRDRVMSYVSLLMWCGRSGAKGRAQGAAFASPLVCLCVLRQHRHWNRTQQVSLCLFFLSLFLSVSSPSLSL